MAKYKVVEAFEVEGTLKEVGQVLEYTEEQASQFGEKLSLVSEGEDEAKTENEGGAEGDAV